MTSQMEPRKHDNFDEFARDYDEVHAETLDISGADRDYFSKYKIEEMARHEDVSANLKMLDFGCGDGNSVKYMREYFSKADLNGTDVSEKSIEEAKAKKIAGAKFTPYDGEALPFEDASMDVIFTSMVFHHISFDRHDALLAEIKRVLKPGGRFYIFEHNPLNPVTRKIVRECAFDDDAILLPHKYTNQMLDKGGFASRNIWFTLFLPRHWIFRWALITERLIQWLPIGAQYYVRAVK
jgi:ubiquinone/menaquinone biosynthesis C-methylase UbiE